MFFSTSLLLIVSLVLAQGLAGWRGSGPDESSAPPAAERVDSACTRLHAEMGIGKLLAPEVLRSALVGWAHLAQSGKIRRDSILAIIDYGRPSTEDRLVVLDLKARRVLLRSLVAHGRNSGENYAIRFSNRPGSLQSCLGFHITGDIYRGVHGYSLRLIGVEAEVNGNAERRSIVIHGADYASPTFAKRHGRLGRSWGCPAVPMETAREIIDAIKDGACLFAFYADGEYLGTSPYLMITPEVAQRLEGL